MIKIRDLDQPIFGKKFCRYNIPYDDYSAADIRNAREAGKKEAEEEYEKKLNEMNRRFVSNLLIGSENIPQLDHDLLNVSESSKYCDANLTAKSVSSFTNLGQPLWIGEIPHQNNIPKGSKLCGYVEIDGTYHKCNTCEHEKIIRQIIWENEEFKTIYFETKASFFDNMPRGMLQEEYFAMKKLGFVKISSFKETPNEMMVFWYNPLTYKQTDLIYPR